MKNAGELCSSKSLYDYYVMETTNPLNMNKRILFRVTIHPDDGGELLVKISPQDDLANIGGHPGRKQLLKQVVMCALNAYNIENETHYQFNDVNVSAPAMVRGRTQMLASIFTNNHWDKLGSYHQIAYIKTRGEENFTIWDPFMGPQPVYHDGICAMVIASATSIFEYAVLKQKLSSSEEATNNIFLHPMLREIFDIVRHTDMRDQSILRLIKTWLERCLDYICDFVNQYILGNQPPNYALDRDTDIKNRTETLIENSNRFVQTLFGNNEQSISPSMGQLQSCEIMPR